MSKFKFPSLVDANDVCETEGKIENPKILTDQSRKSLVSVSAQHLDKRGWTKVSFNVDPGGCDTTVDHRALPGYPLMGAEVSKVGEVFLIAAGDPIPQFGENSVAVCIGSGDVRLMTVQRSTVVKTFLSVKRMIEAGHSVGFCEEGGRRVGYVDWWDRLASRGGRRLYIYIYIY